MMRRLFAILSFVCPLVCQAQSWTLDWDVSSVTSASSAELLPFWARTVKGGYMPETSSTVLTGGADILYTAPSGLFFGAGTNLVGSVAASHPAERASVKALVDRLYLTAGWRMLHADIGLKPREDILGDLSVTGGSITHSGYARNLPGVNLWSDWIYFEKGHWVGIKGNVAQYKMLDDRWTDGTLVHNKSLEFKVALGRKVDLEAGLDHWVQWGGTSRDLGQRPSSWKDFYRVIFALPGGEDATLSDRQNALGNHFGHEFVRVRWRAPKFTMTVQYDMPFEDGRGTIKIQNAPDGVYSLSFNLKDRAGLVTDVLYEYIHTTWQSGDIHDRPATEEEMTTVYPDNVDAYWQREGDYYYGRIVIGGRDDYFNNGEYRSGWTYYGKTIGLPLLTPYRPDSDGLTLGIENNRVRGHHLGVKGNFASVPYMLKATYTSNWGKFFVKEESIYYNRPWQMSLAFEIQLGRKITDLPLNFCIGVYGDFGKLYSNCAGLTLRLTYADFWKR